MAVTNYIWDELSDSVLMETDGSGATTAVYTQEPGPFGGLISERRGNQSRYYHYDGLGSTRQLTDATGQVTDTYLYEAYGQLVQSSGTTVNPFRFVGRLGYYFDQDLSEYYVRARHYDPRLARWLAVDPIGYGTTLNLFAYVTNRPTTRLDPSGTTVECGKLWIRCSHNGKYYRVPVYGESAYPRAYGADCWVPPGQGIVCSLSCGDIRSPSRRELLEHEACHVCALKGRCTGIPWYWSWLGDLWGYCDTHRETDIIWADEL
jgi:RHS repeat-associated protein